MRHKKSVFLLISVLYITSGWGNAKTQAAQDGVVASPAFGVAVAVAPVAGLPQAASSFKIRISITNGTQRILVHSGPIQIDPVQIEIREADRTVPLETDFGCRRHRSGKCGPDVHGSGFVTMSALVVMPGTTNAFDFDIGREFKLDSSHSYLIDVIAKDFVLVEAPTSVIDAPPPFRDQYLTHYQEYNYTKLAPIRSNSITLQ
ncbi:hypothetical protein [Paracidobacterium acidisoli]|uniref:Uncharacterized protein n=1 Tax=Paracidobacterium acidisoli TaxID=2303751 RepID=A0A372IJC4_9BACT|nr:hypothetical protein [Paracidobacterium acidisoli]MBT9332952.1 hypothetical protein [Paracidobacterium acidisoli]